MRPPRQHRGGPPTPPLPRRAARGCLPDCACFCLCPSFLQYPRPRATAVWVRPVGAPSARAICYPPSQRGLPRRTRRLSRIRPITPRAKQTHTRPPTHLTSTRAHRSGAGRLGVKTGFSFQDLIVALSGRAGKQRARAPGRETLACTRARAATSRSGDATRPRSRSRKVTKWRVTRTRARYIQYHTRFWRHDALQAYYSVGTAGP